MIVEEPDMSGSYSYADYLKWTFEERVELIKGKIFKMSPAPNNIHQSLVMSISGRVWSFLRGKKCRVFPAPFDVRLPQKSKDDQDIITVVQPDVCVICNPDILDERGCIGAPDIVVEILSPGNSKKEVKNKYDIYEYAGVKEYWIVDPTHQTLQINKLENDRYISYRALTFGDVAVTDILPGFSLDIEDLFSNL